MNFLLCKVKRHKIVKVFDNVHDLLVYTTYHADTDYSEYSEYSEYSIIGYNDLEHGLNGLTYVNLVNYGNRANWRPGNIRLITDMKNDENITHIYATLLKALMLEFDLKFIKLCKSQKFIKTSMTKQILKRNLNWFWGNGDWQKLINSVYYHEANNFLPFVLRRAYNNSICIQIRQSFLKLNDEINV